MRLPVEEFLEWKAAIRLQKLIDRRDFLGMVPFASIQTKKMASLYRDEVSRLNAEIDRAQGNQKGTSTETGGKRHVTDIRDIPGTPIKKDHGR